MKQLIAVLLLFGLAIASLAQPAQKNQAAPDLSLPGMDDKPIQLSGLKGKVVLLDFWASWCEPCRMTNPHLVKLYKKYHDKGLEILSVSLDSNQNNWKQAVAQDKMDWLQVNDNKGWNAPSAALYDVGAIPSSFLIDKQGTIRQVNMFGWQLESEIKSLLKKK
jgi:thiol-disulfide isomerase/thioredoxin